MPTILRVVANALAAFVLLGTSASAQLTGHVARPAIAGNAMSVTRQQPNSGPFAWLTKMHIPPELLKPHAAAAVSRALPAAQSYMFTQLINAANPVGISNNGVVVNYYGIPQTENESYAIAPPYQLGNIKPNAAQGLYLGINGAGDIFGTAYSPAHDPYDLGFVQFANGLIDKDYVPQISIASDQTILYSVFFGGNSHGTLVGLYQSGYELGLDVPTHGFVYHIENSASNSLLSGSFYELFPLGAFGGMNAIAWGINDSDEVVGSVYPVSYITKGYRTTEFSVPGAVITSAAGINNHGKIVGTYMDFSNAVHGFIYESGHYTRIDYPGANGTSVTGVNDHGDLVGSFTESGKINQSFGFLAKAH
jgi:hypothetical protein